MNTFRHQRIKEVFGELCDESPDTRRMRLRALSREDPDLAHDVEALLRHSDAPAFDIDDADQLSSLVGEIADVPVAAFARPQRIGQYEVIEQIGQGGMGVVYAAQQRQPLERRVAIKVIRPGMDSRQVLTRFDMERRTLAAMNHPGIAAIYDAGVTDEGRPFFVMQHVAGERITTYCDAHRLTVDDRLALFLKVCDAVAHAHQKGVIHRDLKPSNILVETQNGVAVPKVIDFGVAKAMRSAGGDETLHTAPGQLLGTPQYMSPEQTQLGGLNVDTRSDVFSLGALLYELLCGSAPIDADTIRSASFDEVCRMIREGELVLPSRRIEQMDAAEAQQVAHARRAAPHDLARTLRRELDWIARTAMEKEPERRYQTVPALAADVERYSKHEPVSAGPVGASYRLRKFVRRNLAAVAAVSIAAVLIAALGLTIVIGAQATAREAHDNQQIVKFMDDLFTTVNPSKAMGSDLTLREFMDLAAERLATDTTLPKQVRASLRNTIAASYAGLGDFTTAEEHLTTAWALSKDSRGPADKKTLRIAANLVHVLDQLGRDEEALQIGNTWMPVAEAELGPLAYETRMFANNMAILHANLGNLEEAERMYRLTLERDRAVSNGDPRAWLQTLGNLGVFLADHGDLDEAAPMLEECAAIATEHYSADHPATLSALHNLCMLRSRQGKIGEARQVTEQLVEASRAQLGPTHPKTLSRVRNLVALMFRQGEFSEAEALLTPVYDDATKALGSAHESCVSTAELLVTAIAFQDRIEEAVNLALEMYTNVTTEVPETHPNARKAAKLVADAYDTWGKPEQYREWLARAGEELPE